MSAYADAVLATAGLRNYWKFTDMSDSKGTNPLTTIGSQVWRLEPGRTVGEYALMFTNESMTWYGPSAADAWIESYAVVAAPTPLSGAHSIEFLMKPRRPSPTSGNTIFSGAASTAEVTRPTELLISNTYNLAVTFSDLSSSSYQQVGGGGSGTLNLPGWHHVVITINAAYQWDIFIDGTLGGTGTLGLLTGAPVMFAAGHPLTLGRTVVATTSPNESWDGALQHFAVYNVKLSSATVASHYAALGAVPAPSTNRKVWTPMSGTRRTRTIRVPSAVPRLTRAFIYAQPAVFNSTTRPGRMASAPPSGFFALPETIHAPEIVTDSSSGSTRPNAGQIWPRSH